MPPARTASATVAVRLPDELWARTDSATYVQSKTKAANQAIDITLILLHYFVP
jgi:hypothetical protein